MVPLPLAHAGHWAVGLLYLVPIVVLVVVLFVQGRREKVDAEAEDPPADRVQAGGP